jgi:hypothetical protein
MAQRAWRAYATLLAPPCSHQGLPCSVLLQHCSLGGCSSGAPQSPRPWTNLSKLVFSKAARVQGG